MTAAAALLVAPSPPRRPKELLTHGDVRIDDYYWLRDDSRTNPEVRHYQHVQMSSFLSLQLIDVTGSL